MQRAHYLFRFVFKKKNILENLPQNSFPFAYTSMEKWKWDMIRNGRYICFDEYFYHFAWKIFIFCYKISVHLIDRILSIINSVSENVVLELMRFFWSTKTLVVVKADYFSYILSLMDLLRWTYGNQFNFDFREMLKITTTTWFKSFLLTCCLIQFNFSSTHAPCNSLVPHLKSLKVLAIQFWYNSIDYFACYRRLVPQLWKRWKW